MFPNPKFTILLLISVAIFASTNCKHLGDEMKQSGSGRVICSYRKADYLEARYVCKNAIAHGRLVNINTQEKMRAILEEMGEDEVGHAFWTDGEANMYTNRWMWWGVNEEVNSGQFQLKWRGEQTPNVTDYSAIAFDFEYYSGLTIFPKYMSEELRFCCEDPTKF